jgi:hypothetical protein
MTIAMRDNISNKLVERKNGIKRINKRVSQTMRQIVKSP